jgi:hypothetical protein
MGIQNFFLWPVMQLFAAPEQGTSNATILNIDTNPLTVLNPQGWGTVTAYPNNRPLTHGYVARPRNAGDGARADCMMEIQNG